MKTGTSLTDAEIIKALECCSKQSCEGCPYNDGTSKCLMETLPRDTLDLINRQQAEIERFQKENNQFADIGKMYSEIRAEAYKEFAKRLKEKATIPFGNLYVKRVLITDIDNLLKEMGCGE